MVAQPSAGGAGAPAASASAQGKLSEKMYLGNYEIVRTIGEGSFAKVKLAVHRFTGVQVRGGARLGGRRCPSPPTNHQCPVAPCILSACVCLASLLPARRSPSRSLTSRACPTSMPCATLIARRTSCGASTTRTACR
jgi:hypothetical protein